MFYFDPLVQLAMEKAIGQVKGAENKDDARQEAYTAIADSCPLTVEDACTCAVNAIYAYRNRIIRQYHRETTLHEAERHRP